MKYTTPYRDLFRVQQISRVFLCLTFCDHPYLVSLLFAVLLSLHLITFVMFPFFIICLSFFSSRHMPELRFAIKQPEQKSVLTGSINGPLTQVVVTLLAVLAEE